MSESVLPNPQTDPSATAEQYAKGVEPFFNAGVVLDHTRACFLFPPQLDFSKACPCDDCGSKIAKLKASEKEIKAKKDLINEHMDQVDNKEHLCSFISNSIWWTKQMLDIFHKKLEALDKSEKSGVPSRLEKSRSAENLEVLALEIREMMLGRRLLAQPVETVDGDDDYDVLDEIDTGDSQQRYYYGKTNAKNTAHHLLQKIENIEKEHDEYKKTAERQNIVTDPSNSKKRIENQVELLKKLPVQKLWLELVELIGEVQSKEKDWKMFEEARSCIFGICFAVISERNAFWKRSPKGKIHNTNGVDQTLDSIIAKFAAFEYEWERVHATFFTHRANPKRQRT